MSCVGKVVKLQARYSRTHLSVDLKVYSVRSVRPLSQSVAPALTKDCRRVMIQSLQVRLNPD